MKKRWRSILTALLLLLPLTAMPVSADVGPKPSVVVALEGLEGRTCWGTLLSQQEGTGRTAVFTRRRRRRIRRRIGLCAPCCPWSGWTQRASIC